MNSEITTRKSTDEISLKEFLIKVKNVCIFLISKWRIIFLFGFLGGVLGCTYAFFNKPIYTANTTFVLEDNNSSTGGLNANLGGLASIVGVDLGSAGGGIFQGDNIMELYKSRTMIEKALMSEVIYDNKRELLLDRYIELTKLRQKWAKRSDLRELKFEITARRSRLQDSILGIVVNDIRKNYLRVSKPDKKLSIINAEVESTDEFFSKAFDDQIVKMVNDFYIQTKTQKSLNNISILQQKVDSVRKVMNGAIYSAAEIIDATPNLNPSRQLQRVAPVQRSQFNAETNKAILSELVKNLELSKMSLRKETPLIQIIDYPIFPLEKTTKSLKLYSVMVGTLFALVSIVILVFKRLINKLHVE